MSWFKIEGQSFKERKYNLLIAFEIIKKFPLFGAGSGSFIGLKQDIWKRLVQDGTISDYSLQGEHVHCDPVEICSELGIIGFLLWAWVVFTNVANNLQFLPLFVVIFVCSLFYFPLRRPHAGILFWLILGMMSV